MIALGLVATVVVTVVEYITAGYFAPPLIVSGTMYLPMIHII